MQNVSKITVKGQVTIPKNVRDELGVSPGDVIVFTKKGGDIVIKPASTLLDLKGVIVSPKKIKDWASVRKIVKKSVAKGVMEGLE
jgi:AbrB family looped-hinge helix DNA binding protein